MNIKKHTQDGKVLFELTELDAREYEAIFKGLQLFEADTEQHKGIHAFKMLELMENFKRSEPEGGNV